MKSFETMYLKIGLFFIGCILIFVGASGGGQPSRGDAQASGNKGSTNAQIATKTKPGEKVKGGSSFRLPIYKPPKGIGVPGGRIGGGSRGQEALAIFALVPDHLGLTINDQPTLYWYLSQPVQYPLILTVNDDTEVKPILETTISSTPRSGIHSVPLKNFNLTLERDKEYQWFVSLAVDQENPSKNIIAGGRIQRIVPPEGLLKKLRNAEPDQVTAIYSEAGLWYDALASISDLIESHPNQADYRVSRKSLLEQIDLMEVSKAEENLTLPQESSLWNEFQARSIPTSSRIGTGEVH